MQFTPHLCFTGNCAEAFRFYQDVLGGELETLLTYGDSPMAADVPADWHDKILHVTLAFNGHELTGVDLLPKDHERPQGFFVTVAVPGAAEARRVFDGLAGAGRIRVPFDSTFWSPGFGVVVDRFGIPWEVNAVT